MRHGLILGLMMLLLVGCATRPPRNVNNACHIFRENPSWYRDAKKAEYRWHVPVPVQMAIVHQESHFDAYATPPRRKWLGFIPGAPISTAYGYSQALRGTWAIYRRHHGSMFSSRESFGDAVDFIGWYARQANQRARISPHDPYRLYLAYHEGILGYERKTYLRKHWLMRVAHRVRARASLYRAQLQSCRRHD